MNRLKICLLTFLSAVAILSAEAQSKAVKRLSAPTDSVQMAAAEKAHNDSLKAQMARPDYIIASLVVASPGFELYSDAGHAALRLQCPSKKVDNCYEFASLIDFDTTLEFIRGTMNGAFKRLYTRNYIKRYRDEKRGITELRLNLSPEQKVELWRMADKHCDVDMGWKFDYLVNDCSNMVAWLVESSLLEDSLKYNNVDPKLIGTYRETFALVQPYSPWAALFWDIMMGTFGDKPTDFRGHLYPTFLMSEWQKASLVDPQGNERPLTIGKPTTLLKVGKENKPVKPTPITVMTVLVLLAAAVSILQYKKGYNILCRITDVILFTIEFLIGLLVTYLVLFSQQVATEWNWLIIVFNPLPLILWIIFRKKKIMKKIYLLFTFVLVAYSLCTPFSPQLIYSHLYILFAAFALRTFTLAYNNNPKL